MKILQIDFEWDDEDKVMGARLLDRSGNEYYSIVDSCGVAGLLRQITEEFAERGFHSLTSVAAIPANDPDE